MAIITISRGSYSYGKAIAEQVADKLGYKCIAREVLLQASDEFNIDEVKLIRALHDAPSILERFTKGREKYIAYIQAALLRHLQKDNVVYHGLAGHFFVAGVSHVLKVRITADTDERIRLETERNSVSWEEASRVLRNDDEERRKWSRYLYGIDTWDASLYDLVIRIRKIRVNDAVEIICNTARLEKFQTTAESQPVIDDLALAAEVKTRLVDSFPNAVIAARKGAITVRLPTSGMNETSVVNEITTVAGKVQGVTEVKVDTVPSTGYM
ncbi:MAG: cytidylate kinase-like family protein [bacterium]